MINCPRCGASNPVDNRFCGKCGQVLSASGVIDHSPQPDLPDWLRESVDDSKSAVGSSQPPGTPQPPPSELPAWLTEIGLEDQQQPTAETSQAPDWLAQLQATPPTSSTEPASEDLPAWLRSDETMPPSSATPASSEPLPDWLRDLEQPTAQPAASAAASPTQELPDWLRSDQAGAAPPPPAAPAEPIPDWLRALEAESPPPPASAPAPSDELPAWLKEDAPAVDDRASQPRAGSSGLPDWLQEFGATDSVSPAPAALPAAPAPISPVDDVPPWLRDETPTAPPAQPEATAPPARSETPELPAWLMEDSTSDASTQDLNIPLPDWSSEFGAELPAAGSQAAPGADWLQQTDQPVAPPAQPTSPLHTSSADDLPEWLRETTPTPSSPVQPSASDQGLPSWLAEESPTAAPPSSTAAQPAIPAEDLPAWLLDVATPAPAESSSAQSGTLPPWLADETAAAGPTTQPLPSSDPGATQPLPAWLLDEPSSGSGTTAPIAEQLSDQASDELPAWLSGGDQQPSSAISSGFTPPSDELPSWLAADEPTSTASQADELPPWLASDEPTTVPGARNAQAPTEEVPAWLAAMNEPTPPQAPEQQSDELPPWLAADEATPAADADQITTQPLPESQAPTSDETVEFPTWLSDAAPAQPAPAESTTDADLPPWLSGIEAETPAQPAARESSLPTWLDEPSEPAKPKPAAPQSEFLGGLDLPAWLREEGDVQQPTAAPVTETAPDWLQKISPEGDEAVAVQEVAVTPPPPRVVRTPERVESMRLLSQMIAAPAPEPVPAPVRRRRSWLLVTVLGLILLILVGAILYILLNPQLGLSFGSEAAPIPAATTAVETINGLAAQRPVVLAYEWDAQRLGDLRPLEETIITHLAARRDVPLVFLSTDPQGALLAAERAAQINRIADNFHDQYGLGYVNLGFKAGGPIALRQFAGSNAFGGLFAQDASGNDLRANDVVMQSMCGVATAEGCSWQHVGLLIVIADELEDVRGWFEQVRSQHAALPTLLLTTAEIGPQVEPYAAAAGVQLLAGTSAAEAYSRARGVPDERLGRQIDAAAVGGAIFALLIVIGGPIAAFQGYRMRREAEVEEWEQ